MGYRSDVRIVMSKNGFKEFKKQVKNHIRNYKRRNIVKGSVSDEYNSVYNLLDNVDISKEYVDDKNKIYFGWDYLKWYDGYEEVDAIMDSLSKLEDKGYGYSFARLGESQSDYEELYANPTFKDNINYLDMPPLIREFDDNYGFKEIDLSKIKASNEKEVMM